MNNNKFTDNKLVKLQQISWYLIIIIFSIVAVLYFMNFSIAEKLGEFGVILLLALTLIKLLFMAHTFRSVKQPRLSMFSYFLLFLLLSTILIRYLL